MQDKVSAGSRYHPIAGYADTTVIAAQDHARQLQDVNSVASAQMGGRSMSILFGLLLISDSFDGFCFVDQLSDMNGVIARNLGQPFLHMSVWLLMCVMGSSLWIGHMTRVSRWEKMPSCRFRGYVRRLCRITSFCVTGLACLAGHLVFRIAH